MDRAISGPDLTFRTGGLAACSIWRPHQSPSRPFAATTRPADHCADCVAETRFGDRAPPRPVGITAVRQRLRASADKTALRPKKETRAKRCRLIGQQLRWLR